MSYFNYKRAREVKYGSQISHKDLANAAGVTSATVVNYLNGKNKPSFDFVVALHKMTGYDLNTFVQ
jgi:transcriptional regulator with XRE-family HTH domain